MRIPKEELLQMVASMRIVGHEEAARKQLEQAIFLWFHKDCHYVLSDGSAIHTLAAAVQGILWAYAHDSRQRPSSLAQIIKKMPAEQYARIVDSQNFFKHGSVGRKEKGKRKAVSHMQDLTDFFLADNTCTFNRLFRSTSPLMDMFLLRYSWSFPLSRISIKTLEEKLVSSGHELEAVAALDRRSFYDFVGPYAIANLREQKAAGF